jgi:hypothetical protein
MSTQVTITLEPDDPEQPTLVYRTRNMELRGGSAALDGVDGVQYVLTWWTPTPQSLEDLLDTIGPG